MDGGNYAERRFCIRWGNLAVDGTISWAAATLNYWNAGSTVDEDDYIPADNYALQLSATGTLPLDIVKINEILVTVMEQLNFQRLNAGTT